jgi:drug/metabolite transporter (DMT)-like permease
LIASEVSHYPDTLNVVTFKGVVGVLYVGIIGTALFFLFYQKIIRKANPVVASMTFYLQPIFSFVWAFFLLGERLTPTLVVGSILAFLGASFVTKKVDQRNNNTK